MENILLVDCNNFFVSCEQLFNPDLKGKAVCVLSNNDACVIARSNEAKDLGVAMGIPYFIAKKKFKNVIYLSSDREKYINISRQIMNKLKDFTPVVETYSIDEAFLDIRGTEKLYKMNYSEIANKIRGTIKKEIGIEVSIGVAKTKTLAKIASELAKKNSRYHIKSDYEGVFEINDFNREEILGKTAIEDVWGIGKNLHKIFRKHNIQSAVTYANSDPDFIKRNLGKRGMELYSELNGESVYKVENSYTPPKSISKSSSFKEFSDNKDFIKNELNKHLHKVCIKLREHGLLANVLSVMLRGKDFKITKEKISFTTPKNSEFELYKEMHLLFEKLYKKGVIYRSSGVCVYRLVDKKDVQLGLFEDEDSKRKKKLSDTWDKIEQKFGFGALSVGIKEKK